MARIDEYQKARELAVKALEQEPKEAIARRTGLELEGGRFNICFLGKEYKISYPDFVFEELNDPQQEVPLQQQILVLHYLQAKEQRPLQGKWVSFREIPGASFYIGPYMKRNTEPLKKVFGYDPQGFSKAAAKLEMKPVKVGDVGGELEILPGVPVQIVLWQGDDEFPPEASILYDESIRHIFCPEDIAWLGGMLVYKLIALHKG
jgi:hypothetical protein